AVRSDAMAQVRLAGLRIDRQRGLAETVVRTMHAALRRRFTTLLNWHGSKPLVRFSGAITTFVSTVRPTVQTASEPARPPHLRRPLPVRAASPAGPHIHFHRHAAARVAAPA